MTTIRLLTAWVCFALPPAAAATCPGACPADLDGDGFVGQVDLGVLLADYGCTGGTPPGGCPGDVDADGDTDQADLGVLLAAYDSACPKFAYPPPPTDVEAEQIALEMLGAGGGLFAKPGAIQRVAVDLALMRALEPSLASQAHTPAWAPAHLIVQLDPAKPHVEYQCLNDYYQATTSLISASLNMWLVKFPRMLNPLAMASIYKKAPEVKLAEPDGLLGGQNFYKPKGSLDGSGEWLWDVDDGFHDCFDGCDCHVLYVFLTTEAGDVALLSKQQVGLPWCDF